MAVVDMVWFMVQPLLLLLLLHLKQHSAHRLHPPGRRAGPLRERVHVHPQPAPRRRRRRRLLLLQHV
jgi:hypothetical protein